MGPERWCWVDEMNIVHIIRPTSRGMGYFVRCSLEGPMHFNLYDTYKVPTCLWCLVDATSPRYRSSFLMNPGWDP